MWGFCILALYFDKYYTMATQFYRTLDDILRLKEENQQLIQEKLASYQSTDDDYDTELANLRKLLGPVQDAAEQSFDDKSRRHEFIRENNIKPGTPRWFRVMYARLELMGEDPYGE